MNRLIPAVFICLAGAQAAFAGHPGFDAAALRMYTSAGAQGDAAKEAPPEIKPVAISGKVIQVMESGGYTYLLVEGGGKKQWAAIERTEVKTGDKVSLKPGMTMVNFSSKALNRTFDKIVFSDGIEDRTGQSAGDKKKSPGSAAAATPFSKISVEKAKGANSYRVAELFANQKLDGKKIKVRGKVVKVSTGIMNRTWIHIQDGTGSPQKKTHNLVVTSQDIPDVGDIVTVTGTLVRNKDFGSGYRYDVIVEKATIVRSEADK